MQDLNIYRNEVIFNILRKLYEFNFNVIKTRNQFNLFC